MNQNNSNEEPHVREEPRAGTLLADCRARASCWKQSAMAMAGVGWVGPPAGLAQNQLIHGPVGQETQSKKPYPTTLLRARHCLASQKPPCNSICEQALLEQLVHAALAVCSR